MRHEWTFKCFVSAGDREAFREEFAKQSDGVQGDFIALVLRMQDQPQSYWVRPRAAPLTDCGEIWEIRFKSDGIQQRPLGYFGPERKEFTLLFWATEKGGKLKPKGACATAQRRMDIVVKDKERARECNFEDWIAEDASEEGVS